MESIVIVTKSENTIKAYEFLKANPGESFTLSQMADAMGLHFTKILGGLTSMVKKDVVVQGEVELEVDGKTKVYKTYSINNPNVTFTMEQPKVMSDGAVAVLQHLQREGDEKTFSELAGEMGVPVAKILGVVGGLVNRGYLAKEDVEVQVGEEPAKQLKLILLTEEGRNYKF